MLRKTRNIALTFAVASGAVYVNLDKEKQDKVKHRLHSTYRMLNLFATATVVVGDYAWNIYWKNICSDEYDKLEFELKQLQAVKDDLIEEFIRCETEQQKIVIQSKLAANMNEIRAITEKMARAAESTNELLSPIHKRNALRLKKMCASNKGIYIKLGQHVSLLDHLVPIEYQNTLSELLANNPRSSKESVRKVFKQDFNKYPEELFDAFDYEPIASASLAQVHIAYKNGRKFAVKVQHEGLAEGSRGDLAVVTGLVDIIPYIFKEFNYTWLTKETNINLPLELDFLNEYRNLVDCKQNMKKFIDRGDVVIPEVYKSLTSTHILTMGFEDGVYISNKEGVNAMGLNRDHISTLISSLFCEQIFRHGFVHCDPHDANILVRPHPKPRFKGQSQIILLDHGLYKRLRNEFRYNYNKLWQGIILGNKNMIQQYCEALNAGSAYTLLATMLTFRSWDDIMSDDINRLKNPHLKTDAILLHAYAKKYFKDVTRLLAVLPSELLLLFKTNDCLRHIDKILDTPVNSVAVIAEVIADVILKEEWNQLFNSNSNNNTTIRWFSWSFWGSLTRTLSNYMNIMIRVYSLKIYTRIMQFGTYFHNIGYGYVVQDMKIVDEDNKEVANVSGGSSSDSEELVAAL